MVHSPVSAKHISAAFSLRGTSPSGMPLPLPLTCVNDGPRMSSGGAEVELCRMAETVGVLDVSFGVVTDAEVLGASAQQGWIRRAGLRKVLYVDPKDV